MSQIPHHYPLALADKSWGKPETLSHESQAQECHSAPEHLAPYTWDQSSSSAEFGATWPVRSPLKSREISQHPPFANSISHHQAGFQALSENQASVLKALEQLESLHSPEGNAFLSLENLENIYGFSKKASKRICHLLGKGDLKKGEDHFHALVKTGQIEMQMVGVRKNGAPKFYLIHKESLGQGSYNTFHEGFSRRGTARAVTKLKDMKKLECQAHQDALENMHSLSKTIKHTHTSSEKKSSGISRLMNAANGIKISELGKACLNVLLKQRNGNLTENERLIIYKDLFKGLATIHRVGFVHRDVKLANVVYLLSDETGEISGSKIIDCDFLVQKGSMREPSGTLRYASPEKLKHFAEKNLAPAEAAADVWAAMYLICEIELAAHNASCKGLLSAPFIERFQQYHNKGLGHKTKEEHIKHRSPYFNTYTDNLFEKLTPDENFPLDKIVLQCAALSPNQRSGSKQLLAFFN